MRKITVNDIVYKWRIEWPDYYGKNKFLAIYLNSRPYFFGIVEHIEVTPELVREKILAGSWFNSSYEWKTNKWSPKIMYNPRDIEYEKRNAGPEDSYK